MQDILDRGALEMERSPEEVYVEEREEVYIEEREEEGGCDNASLPFVDGTTQADCSSSSDEGDGSTSQQSTGKAESSRRLKRKSKELREGERAKVIIN